MLSKKDVAEKLNVSTRTINRLIEREEIYYHRIGNVLRFTQEDIDDYLRRTKNQ